MKTFAILAASVLVFLSQSAWAFAARGPELVMEEFMIPSVEPGVTLYVRNKHPLGMTRFSGDKIVLYVHGATYPSETAFDLKLNGLSWMDYIAGHGYDVYLVDLRGYGRSTWPPQMDKPALDNPRPSSARRTRSRTWRRRWSSSARGAARPRSTCSAGRGAPRPWAGTRRKTTTRSTSSCSTRRNGCATIPR